MNFGTTIVLSSIAGVLIATPIVFFITKRMVQQGKSALAIPFKVGIPIVVTIQLLPIILTGDLSFIGKIFTAITALAAAVGYAFSLYSVQKTIQKVLGTPIYDNADKEFFLKKKK